MRKDYRMITISDRQFVQMLEQINDKLKSKQDLTLTEIWLIERIINKMQRRLFQTLLGLKSAAEKQEQKEIRIEREDAILLLIALRYLRKDFSFLKQESEKLTRSELEERISMLIQDLLQQRRLDPDFLQLYDLLQDFVRGARVTEKKEDRNLSAQERIQFEIAVDYALEIADDMYKRLTDYQAEYFRPGRYSDAIYQAEADHRLVIEIDPYHVFS